jgi:hypothetical protein
MKIGNSRCPPSYYRAYNSYITNIISPDSTENPKRFWGFIKGLRTENTGIAPLKDSTGMTQSDGSKKEEYWHHIGSFPICR